MVFSIAFTFGFFGSKLGFRMVIKIDLGHFETSFRFKMVTEINSIAIKFGRTMDDNQTYFDCHLMSCSLNILVVK
jgi:hypothetical protein